MDSFLDCAPQADIRRGSAGIVVMARHSKLGVSVALKFHKQAFNRDHSAEVIGQLSSQYVADLINDAPTFDDHDRYPQTPYVMVMYGGEADLQTVLDEQGDKTLPENQIR